MIAGRNYQDGFYSLQGGVLSGVDPNGVPPGFTFRAVNTVFRSGYPETRPSFDDPGLGVPERAKFGRFQGACAYSYAGRPYLAFAVDGDVYAVDIAARTTVRLTEQVPSMDATAERFYFLDTGKHLIVQDGKNVPIIVQGLTARRSDPQKVSPFTEKKGEIGPGGPMAFAYGQLVMALPFSSEFVIGDPAAYGGAFDNYLFDTLNQYTVGAGAFSVSGDRPITAVVMQPQLDMPEGVGPVLVFTDDIVEAYNITVPRENWGTQIISQRILPVGSPAAASIVIANSDVYFRSRDGIRSLRQSRSAEESRVVFTAERGNQFWLENDAPDLLRFSSGVFFDNRVLMTCNPYRIRMEDGSFDVAHGGIVALDTDIDRSQRQSANDICDGLWTGLQTLQLVVALEDGAKRCFAFVKDGGANAIREITTRQTGSDYSGPIRGCFMTGAFGATEARGLEAKVFGSVDVWLSELGPCVSLAAAWKPDRHPAWLPVGRVMTRGGGAVPCEGAPSNSTPDSFPRVSFGSTGDRRNFYRTEVRIDFSGKVRFIGLRVMTSPAASEQQHAPGELDFCGSLDACPDNDYNLGVLK